MTEQKRHEMLKAVIMLWLGGFLVGIAIAIFVFHGFRFEVLRKQRNRIAALRITPIEAKGKAKAAG